MSRKSQLNKHHKDTALFRIRLGIVKEGNTMNIPQNYLKNQINVVYLIFASLLVFLYIIFT
jgi:hypothetical protein